MAQALHGDQPLPDASGDPCAALFKNDDTPVNLQEAYEGINIQEVLDQLDRELIGLQPVKSRIREIAALLVVNRARKQVGLSTAAPSLHMSFTGRPGTGKTTVAGRMSQILHALGYVRKEHNAPGTQLTLRTAAGDCLVTVAELLSGA